MHRIRSKFNLNIYKHIHTHTNLATTNPTAKKLCGILGNQPCAWGQIPGTPGQIPQIPGETPYLVI